jgi:hypothetical protein
VVTNQTFIQQLDDEKWVTSATHEQRVTTTCLDTEKPNEPPTARPDMILPKGEHIVYLPHNCQAELGYIWIPFRLKLHGSTIHKLGFPGDTPIDMDDWTKITQSSKNLTTLLQYGHAFLNDFLLNTNNTIHDFTDYVAHIHAKTNPEKIPLGPNYLIDPSTDILGFLGVIALAISIILTIYCGINLGCKIVKKRRARHIPLQIVHFDPKRDQVNLQSPRPPLRVINLPRQPEPHDDGTYLEIANT